MAEKSKFILAGKITSVHGIKGDLKLFSYLESPENFQLYKHLYKKDGTKIKPRFIRTHKGFAIIRLENINDRTAAEKIIGTEIFISRSEMPETEENQYYYEDMLGMDAKLKSGEIIGKIKSLNNYGAGEIIEITYTDKEKKNDLFSFTRSTFPEINIEENYIVIIPPEIEFA